MPSTRKSSRPIRDEKSETDFALIDTPLGVGSRHGVLPKTIPIAGDATRLETHMTHKESLDV